MPNMQRVHKQSNERAYPQLPNVPGLEKEAEPRSSETCATVLPSELCCFLVTWVEIAPKTLPGLSFLLKVWYVLQKTKLKAGKIYPQEATKMRMVPVSHKARSKSDSKKRWMNRSKRKKTTEVLGGI